MTLSRISWFVWIVGALACAGAASGCGDDPSPQPTPGADAADDTAAPAPEDVEHDTAVQPDAAEDVATGEDAPAADDVQPPNDAEHDVGPVDGGEVDADEDATVRPSFPASVWGTGPWNVGYRNVTTEYVRVGDDEPTVLPLAVWYPTEASSGPTPRYQNLLRRRAVWLDAAPAGEGPLPVLLFSHGNQSFAEQSFFLTEYFASHGWIVIAPDHIGNRTLDSTTRGDAMVFRPQDMVAALDAMQSVAALDAVFSRASDDIVVTGHSFGGYTSLAMAGARFSGDQIRAMCERDGRFPLHRCDEISEEELAFLDGWEGDPRVRLAVPQAPGGVSFFAPDGVDAIEIPVLLMTGALDRTTPDEREGDVIWAALEDGPHLRADFTTAGHFTFSDMCTVLPAIAEDDGCSDEFMDPVEAQRAINALLLVFARDQLELPGPEGEARAILSGEVSLSDTVVLVPGGAFRE